MASANNTSDTTHIQYFTFLALPERQASKFSQSRSLLLIMQIYLLKFLNQTAQTLTLKWEGVNYCYVEKEGKNSF